MTTKLFDRSKRLKFNLISGMILLVLFFGMRPVSAVSTAPTNTIAEASFETITNNNFNNAQYWQLIDGATRAVDIDYNNYHIFYPSNINPYSGNKVTFLLGGLSGEAIRQYVHIYTSEINSIHFYYASNDVNHEAWITMEVWYSNGAEYAHTQHGAYGLTWYAFYLSAATLQNGGSVITKIVVYSTMNAEYLDGFTVVPISTSPPPCCIN